MKSRGDAEACVTAAMDPCLLYASVRYEVRESVGGTSLGVLSQSPRPAVALDVPAGWLWSRWSPRARGPEQDG